MTTVFDGPVWTSYAQLTLTTAPAEPPLPDEAFVGQANGLCGAAVRGALFLVTSTHTGKVPVRVSLRDGAPPELGAWEEVVEASLTPTGPHAALAGWASNPVACFELPAACYRVRWCGSGMDAAHQHDNPSDEQPALDAYELVLWPAAPAADAVLRRTSAHAAYWHDHGFTHRSPRPAGGVTSRAEIRPHPWAAVARPAAVAARRPATSRTGPGALGGDQRVEDLQRLNLLAQAARGRALQAAAYERIGAAARDAARDALVPTLGDVPDELAGHVGEAVLAAILAAMRR